MIRSEAEKLFYDDVREKKKAATGVHYKTGSRGYVGTMRFPSDIMSRKEKYNYRKAGKVMTTNIFDEILTIDEFNKLEKHEQKNRMAYWRNIKTNKEILKGMGINNTRYYEIVAELDLPKAPRTYKNGRKGSAKGKTPTDVQKQQERAPEAADAVPVAAAPVAATPVQEIMVDGLHLVFHGTKQPEEIQRQLKKFIALLEDETDDYYFEMKLMQKVKKSS
jgi:hypothetical protein